MLCLQVFYSVFIAKRGRSGTRNLGRREFVWPYGANFSKDDNLKLVSLASISITLDDISGAVHSLMSPDLSTSSQRYFDAHIQIETSVFCGQFQSSFFDADLEEFRTSLNQIGSRGIAKLGGGRSAEIVFVFEEQLGGIDGSLAVTITAAPSGDDPWPKLSFLEFDVPRSFLTQTIDLIDQTLLQ